MNQYDLGVRPILLRMMILNVQAQNYKFSSEIHLKGRLGRLDATEERFMHSHLVFVAEVLLNMMYHEMNRKAEVLQEQFRTCSKCNKLRIDNFYMIYTLFLISLRVKTSSQLLN